MTDEEKVPEPIYTSGQDVVRAFLPRRPEARPQRADPKRAAELAAARVIQKLTGKKR